MNAGVESFLAVGCPMVFQADLIDPQAKRYATTLRGWRNASYILIDRPTMDGRHVPLYEMQRCVIRFVRDGHACAFQSKILECDTRVRNAYCRLAWPEKLDTVTFRKYERIRITTPCTLNLSGNAIAANILDISLGGCGITTQTDVTVPAGAFATVSFSLPGGRCMEHVRMVVRNCRPKDDVMFLGCEFVPEQVCVESEIAFFIATHFHRNSIYTETKWIVIIDEDEDRAAALKQLFEDRNFSVIATTQTLDGLARIRVSMPSAILINQGQQDLPGILSLQAIKKTPGLEQIPLFLFGADPDMEQQAIAAGATEFFAKQSPAAAIVCSTLLTLANSAASETKPQTEDGKPV